MADRANELSACAALDEIARGRLSAEDLMRACLERIAEREPVVRAFAHLDPDLALRRARALDAGPRRGPLHGLPLGIKDIIETADQPTACGSAACAGNRPAQDAACVALAREAGAVIAGKTVTAELALTAPGPTTNPWNPAHTPGGSSSGSAAAVADRMLPVALGTQTAGSVIRPAAYCGVVGYKPSFGTINRAGVKPLAESFDTIGLLARAVEDAGLVAGVLAGEAPERRAIPAVMPRRIGLCRTALWDRAEPSAAEALEGAARILRRAGVAIDEVTLPAAFDDLNHHQFVAMRFEAFYALAYERTAHAEKLAAGTRAELEVGSRIGRHEHLAAKAAIAVCRRMIDEVFAGVDLLLGASASGEAPLGLGSTGDATFNRLWTGLLVPCVSIPAGTGPHGLPLGVQVIGARHQDFRLLGHARWIEQRLAGACP